MRTIKVYPSNEYDIIRVGTLHAKSSKIKEALLSRSGGYNMPFDQLHTSYRLKFKSPQEVWYDTPVNYSSVNVFSCPVYIHVNDGKVRSCG